MRKMIENALLGKDELGTEYFISPEANNESVLFIGQSGSGKTVSLLQRMTFLAGEGKQIINLSYLGAGQHSGMPEKLISCYERLTNKSYVRKGVVMPLTSGNADEDAGKLAKTCAKAFLLSPGQESACRIAFRKAISKGDLARVGLSSCVHYLNMMGTVRAMEAVTKMTPLLNNLIILDGEFDQNKPILELDFSGFSLEEQAVLVEFTLQLILRKAEAGEYQESGLVVGIDEFQSLSTRKGSALYYLLQIARKQRVCLLLATPEFPVSSARSSFLAMQQCATVAFFQPGPIDVPEVAKLISKDRNKWALELSDLARGSFVATGKLVDKDGRPMTTPIVLRTPRIDEIVEDTIVRVGDEDGI